MKIFVKQEAKAYDKTFYKGEQNVDTYYAEAMVNAGMAINLEEKKEKKEKKTKKKESKKKKTKKSKK